MSLLSLNRYSDLLNKCRYELKLLDSCESHPEYDFILFNIVVGLNHLFEWYLKEKSIDQEQKLQCIKKFNPFSSPYDVSGDFKPYYRHLDNFPVTNKFQEIIRKLCNKAKHFKKTPNQKQNKHYTTVAGNIQCGSPSAVCGAYDHYIYSVEIEDNETDLKDIVSSLVSDWTLYAQKSV